MTGVSRGVLPALFVVTAVCVGCSSGGDAGTPMPSTTTALSSTPAPPPPSTAEVLDDAPVSGLAAVRPCELLSPTDRSTAGLTVLGREKSIGSARACDWTEPGAFGVTITVDEKSALTEAEIDPATAEQIEIDGHAGLRVADESADDGTCAVLLAAGESGTVHVDVSNTSFTDTDQACDRADTVAGLIASKLP